jgi:hypothetical protein
MGGEFGRVAAADVAHRMDHAGRDHQDLAGLGRVSGWREKPDAALDPRDLARDDTVSDEVHLSAARAPTMLF